MITKIYNTKINQTQTLKDFLVEHNFTGEYLIAFEYIVSTVPEELLRDKNGSLSKPFIALLVILSYFVGSSREDILKLAYAKDISALYDITFRNLKKEYDKYYVADQIGDISLNDFILSKENFHDYPEAYLLCLLAIEHGYRPKDIRDSIDEYIKELLQNRGVVEMLELSKAYRGSLTAIKEVLINEMVTKGLNAPTNLSITEPEPHKIDITNFDIPGGLIEKDSLLYRHLMRIKPAGTKIVLPEKNIFDNLVSGVYGATLFSGIGDTNSQGIILKENITPRPTSSELRTAPTVRIKQASAYAVHAADIIITQTNPEDSIVDYRLTVTFPNGGYKVFAKQQVVVPAAPLYSTNEKTVRFINGYKVPIELKVETIAIKRTSEPFMKRDLSGVYTATIAENPHGITILNPEQPALDWEEIDEDLSFIKEFDFFEEFTGTHLQGCGFGFRELARLPATDYSIGDVIRGRLNKIGGSTCPTWAYFKVVAKYTPPSTPSRYVQTTRADFDEYGDYTGTESYIILPKEKPDGYQIVNQNVIGVATNGDYLTDTSNMFRNNPSLYLELDYLDTSNVTNMEGMFRNSQATTLDLSSFDTSNVTNMSNMFLSSQATTLDLSSFDTSNVTDMSGMFYNSQATTLDLSSFDTSNVTNMGGMFAYSQATELDLSSFDTNNVTDMNDMFSNSQATTGYARTQADANRFNNSDGKPATLIFEVVVVIPSRYVQTTSADFDASGNYIGTESYIILPADKPSGYRIRNLNVLGVATNGDYLTSCQNMFRDNPSPYLELDYLDTSNVTNMSMMFYGSQATTLDLSNFDTSNVTTMSSMFGYSKATTLDLSNFDTSNVTNMKSMFWNSQATTLDLSNFDTSSVTDMSGMFAVSQATTLDLSSFDTSNVTNMGSMFENSRATTLDLSNFDTSNVTNMSSMFDGSQATTLDLSNFDTSNVTNMSYMFDGSQATTLDLSSFDTSSVMSMAYMFRDSQATELDLSNFDTSNVTYIFSMFQNSRATTLDLSSFDTSNATNMSYMFYYSRATTLDLSSFDTSNVTDMASMFAYSRATTLDLSSFDTSNVYNMNSMFYGSQATTGYARTQADANRFNNSSYKPATLTFVVKPPA